MTTIGKLGFAATALVLGYAACTSKDYILRGDAGGGTGGAPGTGGDHPGSGGYVFHGSGGEIVLPGTGGYMSNSGTGGPYDPGTGGNEAPRCSQYTTLADCEARAECHSVFIDPGTCGCAGAGCCARFSFCGDGDRAQCKPVPLACAIATPYCESPYVLAYRNNCFEGCVQLLDCAP